MATTQTDIREWIKKAQEKGCTHLLVVCDTYDYEDYPVEIYPKGKKPYESDKDDVEKAITYYNGPNMQKVMEVYNLFMDIKSQLNEHRSWHI